MRLYDPKRDKHMTHRRKRMDSALDQFPIYLEIKHRLENGGLTEGETVGIVLENSDLSLVGNKHPERNLTDNFRRLVVAYGLDDHSVRKTLTENHDWVVLIKRKQKEIRE